MIDADVLWKAAGVLIAAAGFGFGVVKWVQRRIDRVDEKHDEKHDAIAERMTHLERDAVGRAEFSALVVRLESKIEEGFNRLTERVDRMWDHRRD